MDVSGATDASETLLMGTISLDHYLGSGEVLPGGGVVNMAWNWQLLGRPFQLLTRAGADDGARVSGETPRGLYRFRIAGIRDGIVEIEEVEKAALSEV